MPRLTERLLNHNIDPQRCLEQARTISGELIRNENPEPIAADHPLHTLNVLRLTIRDLTEKRYLPLRKKHLTSLWDKETARPSFYIPNSLGERALFEDLRSECAHHIPVPLPEPLLREAHTVRSGSQWLAGWQTRPHAGRYKTWYTSLPETEKESLKNEALEYLGRFRHHPGTRRVWFQLLLFHKEYEDGLAALLADEPDPLKCSTDEKELIRTSVADRSSVPFLFQWIERLIERRTAAHYKEARTCLGLLEQSCTRHGMTERFLAWLPVLHRRYARYAAFRKELNGFENER
ncbi:hypothetical protein CR205_02125 [Alteribacter lacisalsi]|uniref:Uncharacterized protein n=1 Tax=Alteribacter lacisalsi TaxID=2045244 RepID=A0A2W0HKN4_9BACI|nr:hypothetical protein [Alteribacter lacisalsi]PYZ97419.1 hypothetical protein CR205_02125 [Alteribacter lacisalsi]